jgi:diaminopimelate epimerase
LQFWKMHGLGNDFIVIDNRDGGIRDAEAADVARKLCERRLSVGADGLLLLSNSSKADVQIRIFNADGSEAEMCGNGVRCFAKYCYENDIVRKTEFTVDTLAGPKQVWLTVKNDLVQTVRVDMGIVEWERSKIPMMGEGTCINADLRVDEENYKVTCLSMGNPHCVIFVDNVDQFPVEYKGPIIEGHEVFPKHTNVEFVQVLKRDELKVRVWERGCGETLACGTGACASAVATHRLGYVAPKVKVHLPGGVLEICVANHVYMSGPAEKVFEGKLFQSC